MDCSTFKDSEIDALYGELDGAASAAMAEHAATCASCSARFERLRSTRGLVLSVAIEPVADNFESRVMAAVDAGMASRAPVAPVKAEGGAKIFGFMTRPAFAVAATFVLMIGAATFLMQRSSGMQSAARSADESSPAPAAIAASGYTDPGAVAAATAAPPPPAAAAPMVVADNAESAASGPVAMATARSHPRAPSMAPPPTLAAKPSPAKVAAGGKAADPELTAAKNLASSGHCAEALPRLEALKASHPEVELLAARCIAQTRGCGAAAPRFDTAAQRNAGTETGRRATLEGARCYQQAGNVVAARQRYQTAKDEGLAEAAQGLDSLDHKAGAGTHPAARPASPKLEAPAETAK